MDTENKHHSGVSGILERIEAIIEERIDLNFDFPLSGGDHPRIVRNIRRDAIVMARQQDHPKRSSFLSDLGREFPLSGGEYER